MKVFIIGGTGFIGYHATLELLKREHIVSTLSLPDIDLSGWYPDEVLVSHGNVFEMPENDLISLFSGHDALIYAIGPDDRSKVKGSAYEFFHKYLVEECGRILAAARKAGIKKCAITGSYFAYFDRLHPEKGLFERHPYIKCRTEQEKRAISEGKDTMSVSILELPYIFGTMPKRVPLWEDILFRRLHDHFIVLYPKGGSNMIAVESVAEAIAGAIERGEHGTRYLVGDANLSWVQMIRIMLKAMNMEKKPIITLPCFLASLYGKWMKTKEKKKGFENGLDLNHIFNDIMCQCLYFDPSSTANELNYGRGGLEKSINKTVTASLKNLEE